MTDQTPSLDSLCETIRELLPKVTPLLAPEDVDGGTMVIDDPDSQTLSAVQTGDASPRAFGMWKKDAEFFAWCLIHRRLIALAPTMATALLSLASERAKQEAVSREAVAIALFENSASSRKRNGHLRQTWVHLNSTFPEAADNWRELADHAIAAWQAASKPAVQGAEGGVVEHMLDCVSRNGWPCNCGALRRAAKAQHLTEAPALSDEQRMVLGEALWRAIVEADLFKLHTTNAELWRLIGLKAETAIMRLTSSEGSGAKEGK